MNTAAWSNPTCATREERCEARAVVWRIGGASPGAIVRLCACCHAIWVRHGLGHLYQPVPTERMALLGCAATVRR